MARRPARSASWARLLLLGCLGAAVLLAPAIASARDLSADAKADAKVDPTAWCGPGFDALPNDVCYIDGRASGASTARGAADGRRTLVIWLHGVIALHSNWSQNHEKMLARVAKYNGVEVIFPKGLPTSDGVYAWPGTIDAQEKNEQALIDQWMAAKTILEEREHKAFDDVYVFGFSSGAYFASSLAMRGRLAVDGYAVFAGGQPMPARAARDAAHKLAPVFVGVCADDPTTAAHSRAFAGSLAAAGIPRMVSEQHVGHGLSEIHFAQALSFLGKRAKPTVALAAAGVPFRVPA